MISGINDMLIAEFNSIEDKQMWLFPEIKTEINILQFFFPV